MQHQPLIYTYINILRHETRQKWIPLRKERSTLPDIYPPISDAKPTISKS